MTRFLVILALLQRSGTEPKMYACAEIKNCTVTEILIIRLDHKPGKPFNNQIGLQAWDPNNLLALSLWRDPGQEELMQI